MRNGVFRFRGKILFSDTLSLPKFRNLPVPFFAMDAGSFIGMTPPVEKQESLNSSHGSEKIYENEHIDFEEEDETFNDMIGNLGASGVFDE